MCPTFKNPTSAKLGLDTCKWPVDMSSGRQSSAVAGTRRILGAHAMLNVPVTSDLTPTTTSAAADTSAPTAAAQARATSILTGKKRWGARSVVGSVVQLKKARLRGAAAGVLEALSSAAYTEGHEANQQLLSAQHTQGMPEVQLTALLKKFLMEQELLLRTQQHELHAWVKGETARQDRDALQLPVPSSSSTPPPQPAGRVAVWSRSREQWVQAKFQCSACKKGFLQRRSFSAHEERRICEGRGKATSAARTRAYLPDALPSPKPHVSAFLLFLKDWRAEDGSGSVRDEVATAPSSSSSSSSSSGDATRQRLAAATAAWKAAAPAVRRTYRERSLRALQLWQRESEGRGEAGTGARQEEEEKGEEFGQRQVYSSDSSEEEEEEG